MHPFEQLGGRLLVIFDGHCGLCDRAVRWLVARDRGDRLRFAASASPLVAALLERNGFSATPEASAPGTILVVTAPGEPAERVLVRSAAVIALLGELPRPWPAFAWVLGLVPMILRDAGYRLVARFRYRIWGRLESCPLPTPEQRGKFLESPRSISPD